MKWLTWFVAATACLVAGLGGFAAQAAGSATIQIIFDGSGSMWGKLAGDPNAKFVTAREALKQSLAGLSRSTQVGLVAFGHRRPGECTDVEQMLPPQPADAERITAPLLKFNPKGLGPLSLAMRRAAQALPGGGPEALVLIHDDPDNCRDDPCAAAAEIHAAKPKMPIYVVSLGMKAEDVERMSCVARITGGKSFDAQTPQGVAAAISEAIRSASLEPAIARAPPAPQPAARHPETGPPGLRLAVSLGAGSDVLERPVRWRIVRQPADPATPAIELTEAFPNVALTPGAYAIEARLGLAEARQTIEVTGNRPMRATLPLNAGAIQLDSSTFPFKDAAATAVITVWEQAEQGKDGGRVVWLGTAEPTELILPAGMYKIVLQDRQFRAEKVIAVPAGSQGAPMIASTAGRIRLQARDGTGAAASGAVLLSVLEDDPTDPTGRREVARTAANRADFTLPAGTYHLVARKGAAEVRELVALRAGEEINKSLTLNSGRLMLGIRLAGSTEPIADQVAYRIVRLDDLQREIARADEPAAEIELPAGRYRVESRLGSQNAVASREVEVKAGVDQSLVLEQPAASIRLKLASAAGAAIPDVFWEVRDDAGQTVWRAIETEPKGILAAGRYRIRAETRDRRVEKTVDIRAGETRTLEFTTE